MNNKFCDYRDFNNLAFQQVLKSIHSEIHHYMDFTARTRKVWETAMCIGAMQYYGFFNRGKSVLNIGSGCERIILYLANRVRKLVCIDKFDHPDAREPFLAHRTPGGIVSNYFNPKLFPYTKFNRDVIEPMTMDGLDLKFDSGTFDAVFSVSSMEHFENLPLAYSEALRVLKPGGMFFISIDVDASSTGIERAIQAIPANAKLVSDLSKVDLSHIDGVNERYHEAPLLTIGSKLSE